MSPCFVFHSFVCFHTVVGISQFDYEISYIFESRTGPVLRTRRRASPGLSPASIELIGFGGGGLISVTCQSLPVTVVLEFITYLLYRPLICTCMYICSYLLTTSVIRGYPGTR